MVSAADGTEVAVTTLGGTAVADSVIPLAASFVRPPVWLIDLFLFARVGAISCPIFLEVTGFKVTEAPDFGEFNVFDLPGIAVNGFIKIDDF